MKKLLTSLTVALLAVLLCFAAGCGGATGSLSSFVSAVKDGDYAKAANYVVGQPDLGDADIESGEIYEYIYEKTAGSFKYSVEEQTMNEDETICTVKISYSCYSQATLLLKYAAKILTGSEATKSTVNACLDDMTKTEGTTTVLLYNDEDDGWLVGAASATALIAIINA